MKEGTIKPTPWSLARHELASGLALFSGRLPDDLILGPTAFESLWAMHPAERSELVLYGKRQRVPRFQQAFGRDYRFSGNTERAAPIPPLLTPLHTWARERLDPNLNGILVVWYDLAQGHYIGPHRDKTRDLVEGSPIVTISFGTARPFRLRDRSGKGPRHEFQASNGAVFVMPWETNQGFKHEVPKTATARGRRISVTMRVFM